MFDFSSYDELDDLITVPNRMTGLTVWLLWQDEGAEVVHPEGSKPLLTVLLCIAIQVLFPVYHVPGPKPLVLVTCGIKQ